MRYYEGFTEHVALENFQSLDRLAEAALSGDGAQVLVDLAAQSSSSLRGWMDDTGAPELFREAGVMVSCRHTLDDGKDSLEMLGRLLENFQTETRHVIVLNHGRGARFDAFHGSPQKLRAQEFGAEILELPKLHEGSMRQVDHSNSSFWAAIHASEDGSQLLGILDRQRVKVRLRRIYSELGSLGLSHPYRPLRSSWNIFEFLNAGSVEAATFASNLPRQQTTMKTIIQQFTALAAVLFTVAVSAPESQAANIRLRGSGYYKLGTAEVFVHGGKGQSGRYRNLGTDYYHKVEYGMDFITNSSGYKSGSLSYEFWALPYYGATRGIVLMTCGLSPLSKYSRYVNLYRNRWGISLNLYRFPEQNIWEYTSRGWKFRDSLAFSRKTLL